VRRNVFGALVIALALTVPCARSVLAQAKTEIPPLVPGVKPVTAEHIKIHGTALEGNLEGDDVDRDVIVFLPPSYAADKSRRYPVVYALHGYSIGAEQWSQEIHVPQTIEGAFAQGAKDMIVVLPDARTCTTVRCIPVPSPPATLNASSPKTWSPISTPITARFPTA
jgi:enterochelin esterase-like enzyme